METIYIDSLFFTNLLADYLLLLCSGRICGLYLRRGRYLLSALLGAVYAVLVFLPGFYFLAQPGFKLLCGALMGLIAFGGERHFTGCTLVFLFSSAALGGALWALEMSFGMIRLDGKLLVLCFALSYALLRLAFRTAAAQPGKATVRIELEFLGRSCAFTALLDSGNCLQDPISGAEVMLCCPQALSTLFGEAAALLELTDPLEVLKLSSAFPELEGKLRLVPYSAVGSQGLLPAFRPDKLLIDGKQDKCRLVAISPSAAGKGFDGIV